MKLSKVSNTDMQAINNGYRGKWKQVVSEFVSSGMATAELKDFECKPVCAYQRVRTAIRNGGYPAKAVMRKGRIFIIRTDGQAEFHEED